jgi:hypothetical protein
MNRDIVRLQLKSAGGTTRSYSTPSLTKPFSFHRAENAPAEASDASLLPNGTGKESGGVEAGSTSSDSCREESSSDESSSDESSDESSSDESSSDESSSDESSSDESSSDESGSDSIDEQPSGARDIMK